MEWLFQQTGPVVTAILALVFMQANHKAYMVRERENAEVHREDKKIMVSALAENVAAKTRLYEVIVNLDRTIERRNKVIEHSESGDD